MMAKANSTPLSWAPTNITQGEMQSIISWLVVSFFKGFDHVIGIRDPKFVKRNPFGIN